MSYDSTAETLEHINQVRQNILSMVADLKIRADVHDQSKLQEPEKSLFDKMTGLLRASTYGSDEYNGFLEQLKPALDHHYSHNSHHPEHYGYLECNGCFRRYDREHAGHCETCGYGQFQFRPNVAGMCLLDLVEMLADWYAATKRHADGNLANSIEINRHRFGYSDELKSILFNTAKKLGWLTGSDRAAQTQSPD